MRVILTSLSLFLSLSLFSQTTGIEGSVKTSDGSPAESVTVSVKGSNKATATDRNGHYAIKGLRPGALVIILSFAGLPDQEQSVSLSAGAMTTLDLTLKESSTQLQQVVVSSKNLNKVNSYVAKMPLKNLENPQVYSTVSSEILKQQGISNYDDALRNVPGISRTWESTGRGGDGASYFALRGFEAQPGLVNGLPGLTSGNLDPADIEQIDVIKGPSGTLFGGSFYGYGGIINTITKKPYFSTGGEIACNVGSFGLNRITADVNTPLSKKNRIALRVNTAYHSENSFQDAGFKRSFFIAPSLVYEVNDRLSFHLLTEILVEKRAVAPVFFNSDRSSPLDFKNIRELNLNPKLSFTSNDLSIKNPRYNLQGQILYKLSDQWSSQTVLSGGIVKSNGIYTYIWDDVAGDSWFSQYFHNEHQTTHTIDIQQNFNGDFRIGSLRNRLLLGLEYFTRSVKDNGSGWASARNVTPQGGVGYFDPYTMALLPPVALDRHSIDSLLATTQGTNSHIRNSSYAAYFSDVVNLTPHLLAMISLRADFFDSKGEVTVAGDGYHQFAVSPKFGLLYQVIPEKVSLFANYMSAFVNVAPTQVYDSNGAYTGSRSFKPEHANQLEFGAKANLFSNMLGATLSFYDIKVANRVYPDPANINNSVQGGQVGSKGVELEINANPIPGLNLIAGVSHNETKVLVGNKNDFYNEPGRTQGGQGPRNLANLWATYKFIEGKLKNFGIGLGGNYAGVYKVIDNSVTGVFELPSYALLNGGLFYNADKFRVSFNVNNINNKQYYIGYWSVNPQKQRNFTAGIAWKF